MIYRFFRNGKKDVRHHRLPVAIRAKVNVLDLSIARFSCSRLDQLNRRFSNLQTCSEVLNELDTDLA